MVGTIPWSKIFMMAMANGYLALYLDVCVGHKKREIERGRQMEFCSLLQQVVLSYYCHVSLSLPMSFE